MGIAMQQPLLNEQIEDRLQKYGIPLSAESFIRESGIPEEIVRNRIQFSEILVAYSRQTLSHEMIRELFLSKKLLITVSDYLNACARQGIDEKDATQLGFVCRFIRHYNPTKRLEDQSTIVQKHTVVLG